MLVKPENLRGAANICSDSGKRPLAAMFGADETLQGGGLAIYCLKYHLYRNVSAACIQDIISTKLCHEFIWKVLEYSRVFGVQVNFRS